MKEIYIARLKAYKYIELFAGTLCSTLISRRQFRDGLKSHFFTGAYFWSSENIFFKSVIYLLTYLLNLPHLAEN